MNRRVCERLGKIRLPLIGVTLLASQVLKEAKGVPHSRLLLPRIRCLFVLLLLLTSADLVAPIGHRKHIAGRRELDASQPRERGGANETRSKEKHALEKGKQAT